MTVVSAETPDWSRETPRQFWDPGRKLLKAIRDHARLAGRGGPLASARRKMIGLRHRFWSVVTQCDIPIGSDIAGGLLMPHPQGVVIHPAAKIGPNCLLMHQTTVGVVAGAAHPPVLGGHVDVGAGAKILGAVTVGDHALIGANAVVIRDVAAFETAGGVPAKSIGRNKKAEAAEAARLNTPSSD